MPSEPSDSSSNSISSSNYNSDPNKWPEPLIRSLPLYRKYDANTNTDSDDYILAQYDVIYKDEHDIINGGATQIVRWSIYHLNDISEDEKHITPVDKFHKM